MGAGGGTGASYSIAILLIRGWLIFLVSEWCPHFAGNLTSMYVMNLL